MTLPKTSLHHDVWLEEISEQIVFYNNVKHTKTKSYLESIFSLELVHFICRDDDEVGKASEIIKRNEPLNRNLTDAPTWQEKLKL